MAEGIFFSFYIFFFFAEKQIWKIILGKTRQSLLIGTVDRGNN